MNESRLIAMTPYVRNDPPPDMTHSYMSHDLFIYATRLIHMHHVEYFAHSLSEFVTQYSAIKYLAKFLFHLLEQQLRFDFDCVLKSTSQTLSLSSCLRILLLSTSRTFSMSSSCVFVLFSQVQPIADRVAKNLEIISKNLSI